MTRRFGVRGIALLAVVATAAFASRVQAQDIECDPGDREVRSLEFKGNTAFTDAELSLRIVTTASSWARRHLRIFGSKRCLDSEELPRDKLRLQLLYRNAGYPKAKIDTVITPAGPDQVNVVFMIDEGQPLRIVSFAITGLDSVPNKSDIVYGLWTAVGKPFDVTHIGADGDTVRARLRNSGYPRPEVLPNSQTRTDSMIARVELQVLPGPRVHVADVMVDVTPAENRKQQISERVVKKLAGIDPGNLYREQSLADAQRNLYQTGAYRYVEIAPIPDSAKLYKDSVVELQAKLREDYMRDLTTEFGWTNLDCFRTRAQVVDKNVLGGAQRLELTGQLSKLGFGDPLSTQFTRQNLCLNNLLKDDPFSSEINYSANATVRQPTLFGTWATPAFSLYSEKRGEYKAYLRTTYVGGDASLLKLLRNATSLRLGYSLEYGKTQADPSLLCAAFSRCDPQSLDQIQRALPLAIASATVARVRTDNPISPTSGYAVRLESRNSATFIGSDPSLTFAKGVGDVAWYHGLGWGSVLAMRLRAGGIWGGANIQGARVPPQQERLYAGGASSVRGFQQNELGALLYVLTDSSSVEIKSQPRAPGEDSTVYFQWKSKTSSRVVPVGGNSMLVANLDYRLRDPFFPQLLQYTLFTDVGTVWIRGDPVQSPFQLRWTPGIGVRIFTPVGPVQINAGYNPYKASVGQAFFTPPTSLASSGFTGVYCAVPAGTNAPDIPLARLQMQNGKPLWVQDPAPSCPATFSPPPRNNFFNRLTFTFSIGPDF
jgi:outer membrane protein insertion porin family/translocation and assembly module TamA